MFCPVCKKAIQDGSLSCPLCGASIVNPYEKDPSGAQQAGPFSQNYGSQNYGPGAPPQPTQPIPDYLIWSILEMLCCCLPLGIVSLIFSIQANSAKKEGRYHEALQQAEQAKRFLIYGLIAGVVSVCLQIAFFILYAMVSIPQ